MSKRIETYEIVAGTRNAPGAVLRTLRNDRAYRCGGPATAALRAWLVLKDRGVTCFFRRVA